MKKVIVFLMSIIFILMGCEDINSSSSIIVSSISESSSIGELEDTPVTVREKWTPSMSTIEKADSLLDVMSIKQKVGQMLQVERNSANYEEAKNYYLGSIFSGGGSVPGTNRLIDWTTMSNNYQNYVMSNDLQIPILYGIDAVHGHNNVKNATIFPHNIGLGAANDPDLMYEIGKITAKEMKALGHHWTYAPSVAAVQDIKWGRSYESYSEDPKIVEDLSIPLIEGLQSENVLATAKHYLLDGFTKNGRDQGESFASEEVVRELFLDTYKKAVEAGVKTIMPSYSSLNNVKMHENSYWLNDVLKGELGFEGIVISDYNAILQLSGNSLKSKVARSINAGVDMIMQANGSWLEETWQDVYDVIISAYNDGLISKERINDAVRRILMVKIDLGLFDNYKIDKASQDDFRKQEYLDVAREAVSKSLVLLKNDNNVLPLSKNENILLLGPGIDNIGYQCGGWTISWQGSTNSELTAGTTILEAFKEASNGNVYTSTNDKDKADVVVVVIGEKPYAEFEGDNNSLSLTSNTAMEGNLEALEQAYQTGLPVVVLMLAGRPLIVTYEINNWDAFVMAWLPGTEGLGISDVLFGDKPFTGKLPVTWPKDISQSNHSIIMDKYSDKVYNENDYLFPFGYGLTY
ncbi:TPA: glycoside hydrolase family 3 protein [bacterium]|nr:glycoside hydrolase family 3 protein [bacterium]